MSHPEAVTAPAPAEQTSLWEDFIDIFYDPAAVFRRRMNGNWFVPMAVVTVAIFIITFLTYNALRPVYDAEYDRNIQAMIRQNPRLTPDMLESGRKFAEVLGKFGVLIIYPVLIFVVGLVLWLAGKLFGSRQTFGNAMVVSGYAQVPRILGALALGVQGLLMDPTKLTGLQAIAIGPARFVSPDATSAALYTLLMRLDLFTVWATVLLGVGLYVTGKVSKGSAAAAAVIVWLVAGLPTLRNVLMTRRG